MLKLRFALLAAAAAVVLGTASAMAMQESAGADPDSHGDTVSSAAQTTCPHGPNGVHGQCVSGIASANGQSHSDEANPIAACKAAERVAKGSGKPDKATKAAAHLAFKQCVSAKTGGTDATDESSDSSDSSETEGSEAS